MCGFSTGWWIFPLMFLAAVILLTSGLTRGGRWKRCAPYWWWDGDQDRIEELEEEIDDPRDQLDQKR